MQTANKKFTTFLLEFLFFRGKTEPFHKIKNKNTNMHRLMVKRERTQLIEKKEIDAETIKIHIKNREDFCTFIRTHIGDMFYDHKWTLTGPIRWSAWVNSYLSFYHSKTMDSISIHTLLAFFIYKVVTGANASYELQLIATKQVIFNMLFEDDDFDDVLILIKKKIKEMKLRGKSDVKRMAKIYKTQCIELLNFLKDYQRNRNGFVQTADGKKFFLKYHNIKNKTY